MKDRDNITIQVEALHRHDACFTYVSYRITAGPMYSTNAGDTHCNGIQLHSLGLGVGDQDRFKITIERLPRLAKTPRFPKNPWKTKKPKGRSS